MSASTSELSRALPQIPRAQWHQHPRYRTQTLLLGSHANFLQISAHLIACAEHREDSGYIRSLYTRWISAMRSHEGYEEHKLYPYLAHRWGVDCGAAQAGHAQLHDRDRGVRRHLSDPQEAAALAEALRMHDAILRAHLLLEEELVIPLLLELSPAEFHRYADSPIEALLGT